MKTLKFSDLFNNKQWLSPAFVTINDEGKTINISSENSSDNVNETIDGYALPGFQNAHSHAFQYAMAGLAEIHADPSLEDDFWSWRNTMYKIALSVSPEHLESIATMLYTEMLRHGYTAVAEFHYLHHDKNGKTFINLSEMGERLIAAAKTTGIKITLVPIFYQKGGFAKEPEENQKRFISQTVDDYLELLEASKASAKLYTGANIGIGIHSLRAVDSVDVVEVIKNHSNKLPIHIHVSEQLKEIEESINHLGARPVEWLLNNLELNDNFHLVHATHIIKNEIGGLAKSKANVVLCPSTEGNLGDGLFPLKTFQNLGGNWSIGTDSHIGLNPLEELRLLDYGQRLITHKRNQFTTFHEGNTGHYSFDMSLKSGRKAMNNHTSEFFPIGADFDAIVINAQQPLLSTSSLDKALSTLIYSGDVSWIKGTMVSGRWVVKDQHHIAMNQTVEKFKKAMKSLKIRL